MRALRFACASFVLFLGVSRAADVAQISDVGVGEVHVGMALDAALNKALTLGTVAPVNLPPQEGEIVKGYQIRSRENNTTVLFDIEPSNNQVWRLTVRSSQLRDSRGIGVGSPLREVQAAYPGKIMGAESGSCLISPHTPGRSYCFSGSRPKADAPVRLIYVYVNKF